MASRINKLADKVVRCSAWSVCNREDCNHWPPHEAEFECIWPKYCSHQEFFVEDRLASEIAAQDECDPNLVFKKQRYGK